MEKNCVPCSIDGCDGKAIKSQQTITVNGEIFYQNIYTCEKCGHIQSGGGITPASFK